MKKRRKKQIQLSIEDKAQRVLIILFFLVLLVCLRIAHLTLFQQEKRSENARRPMVRTVIEPARRATIRDRYNTPLAINKMQYNAAVCYAQIRELPGIIWKKDADGKKTKIYYRKAYIRSLAELLAQELDLNPERIEDLIHGKAALYNHLPFIIKHDITEAQYYRLKMLMHTWTGLHAQHQPKRYYPKGPVGAEVIGYIGAIDRKEYDAFLNEKKELESLMKEAVSGLNPELPEEFESLDEVAMRLAILQDRSYSINDSIGKAGIESAFENDLRGFYGKKCYYTDSKGNFLKQIPGSQDTLPGNRLLLALSSELQQCAEETLIKTEPIRKIRVNKMQSKGYVIKEPKEPWIKGGAIVAMDPNSGEILAMASYPRYDPNDFIPSGNEEIDRIKRRNVRRWLETDSYLSEIWEGKSPLTKEVWNREKEIIETEELYLDWEHYLDLILTQESHVKQTFNAIQNLSELLELLPLFDQLIQISEGGDSIHLLNYLYPNDEPLRSYSPARLREQTEMKLSASGNRDVLVQALAPYFTQLPHTYDKLLFIDLCRLCVDHTRFSERLKKQVKGISPGRYQSLIQAKIQIHTVMKEMARQLFSEIQFMAWREEHQKSFLKEKRDEEKLNKHPTKPFTDYLDKEEKRQFSEFWKEHGSGLTLLFLTGVSIDSSAPFKEHFAAWHRELALGAHSGLPWVESYRHLRNALLRLPPSLAVEFLDTMRGFDDLDRPLVGRYSMLRNGGSTEKDLALAFYPKTGFGYARSGAYREACPIGSLFKLVTGYEALRQTYLKLDPRKIEWGTLNPLTIIDQTHRLGKGWSIGYDLEGKSIPLFYKGGILPRSMTNNIGKTDLRRALEKSSNPYFSLLAVDILEKPTDLLEAAKGFSFGSKTGIDLPGELKGKLPDDLEYNPSGLYSFAIGQHSMFGTPLQAAAMLSAFANGGKVLKPKILSLIAGPKVDTHFRYYSSVEQFPYYTVGLDFPLFLSGQKRVADQAVSRIPTEIVRELFLPTPIRSYILESMYRIAEKARKPSTNYLSNLYSEDPELLRSLKEYPGEIVGKTSTAEAVESICIDRLQNLETYNHIWFGSICLDEVNEGEPYLFRDRFGKPELVVVVYQRFGSYGKDAAPIAAVVAEKWREIKSRH